MAEAGHNWLRGVTKELTSVVVTSTNGQGEEIRLTEGQLNIEIDGSHKKAHGTFRGSDWNNWTVNFDFHSPEATDTVNLVVNGEYENCLDQGFYKMIATTDAGDKAFSLLINSTSFAGHYTYFDMDNYNCFVVTNYDADRKDWNITDIIEADVNVTFDDETRLLGLTGWVQAGYIST